MCGGGLLGLFPKTKTPTVPKINVEETKPNVRKEQKAEVALGSEAATDIKRKRKKKSEDAASTFLGGFANTNTTFL